MALWLTVCRVGRHCRAERYVRDRERRMKHAPRDWTRMDMEAKLDVQVGGSTRRAGERMGATRPMALHARHEERSGMGTEERGSG